MPRSPTLGPVWLALALTAAACSSPSPITVVTSDVPAGDVAPTLDPSTHGIRRLTQNQFQNSVHDLLGASITVPTDLEADTYEDEFASVGMAQLAISAHAMEQFEAAAFQVAHQAMSAPATRAALVGCQPSGMRDDACAAAFVRSFGLRAWRRPLTDVEVARYTEVAGGAATLLGDFYSGLEYATAGLLLSPNFLYLVQTGEPDPASPTRRRFTGYEMATRLSFFFWDTTPDEALLEAARRGDLATAAGVRTQAERLLGDARGRAVITRFFSEFFGLRWLPLLQRDPTLFPQFQSASFPEAVLQQTLRDIDDRVFVSDGDYRGFFDSTSTFVNDELARFYQLPPVAASGFVRVELPADGPRAGLLGYVGFEAMFTHDQITSPTLRGFILRRNLLCQVIPLPPADVSTAVPEVNPTMPTTLRQRLTLHRQSSGCASCHEQMDPIGFGLENFDPGGGYRITDNGLPIDATGTLDGTPFTGPRGLATALHDHPAVPGCFVRRLFRFATGQLERDSDQPSMGALEHDFAAAGFRVRRFLVEFAASDPFRYATTAP